MLGALLYLRLTSLKNWLRQRLVRLRQPKYLAGAIVGAAYFWFFFFAGASARPPPEAVIAGRRCSGPGQTLAAAGVELPGSFGELGLASGALLLLGLVALTWIFSVERASLGFSEAEIAFLFPAPVTRNRLVQFRLVDVQLRSLVGVLFMTLLSHRWTFLGGSLVGRAMGWWLVFAALNLHLTAARFTLTRLADRGFGTWRRRALVIGALVTLIGITVARLTPGPAALGASFRDTVGPVGRELLAFLNTAPLSWALWPGKFLLGPFFADHWQGFLLALGPALLVVGVLYWWVLRSVVSFEEGSITRAEKRAAAVAAMRSGQRLGGPPAKGQRPPFPLAGTGRPEIAFLWKNLLSTFPWLSLRTWLVCALLILGGAAWVQSHPAWRWVLIAYGPVALVLAGYTLVAGPQFARQDIRADLAHADLLKTYPLPGWQIVLGELLAPTAILTGILWLLLLAEVVSFTPAASAFAGGAPKLREFAEGCATPWSRLLLALGAALLVPPVVALQLLVPNAAALVFPAWFQSSRQRGGGIDVVGQRLIFFFAQLAIMLLAILPAALIGLATVSVACFALGLPAVVGGWLAVALMLALLVGELWLGVYLLGERFEQLDLSAELRP
jgi:hypothetical protein